MNHDKIYPAITTCLATIRKEQLADGGFSHAKLYHTTFLTANILGCLNAVPDEACDIRRRATEFLLVQKSDSWSFNYWARNSKQMKEMTYPDDLDDTFVALSALYGYDSNLIDGTVLAHVAKFLTAVEVAPGGPYRTWLLKTDLRVPDAWRDVDVAVNSNTGYFLSLIGLRLPNLEKFIDERIGNDPRETHLLSPYYPNAIQVIYFISRFYHGSHRAALTEILLGKWGDEKLSKNILNRAMMISALINLDSIKEISSDDFDAFIALIGRDGGRSYPFCIDPSRNGKLRTAGSPAITAAFCAEALSKYLLTPQFSARTREEKLPEKILLARIKIMAQAECRSLPEYLKKFALAEIEKVEDMEIVELPYLMNDAIKKICEIPARILDELALANLCGWIAYSIYDNIFDLDQDGETNNLILLSIANFFLRLLTAQYSSLEQKIPGFRGYFADIMNTIDNANIKEQIACRIKVKEGVLELPSAISSGLIEELADRSLGHALPAIAIIFAAGRASQYEDGSRINSVTAILSFFRNYLIARQLHDDAHDWKEDLLHGRITLVGARILEIFPSRNILLAREMPDLQKIFWRDAVLPIIGDIKYFLHKAREALRSSKIIIRPEVFEKMLSRLESAADRTLHDRAEALKFIIRYHFFPSP